MDMNEDGILAEFEIQPVVGLDEVNPLWDLHLARPENVVIHSLWGHEAMIMLFISGKVMVYLGSLSEKNTGFFGSFSHTGGGVSQNPKTFVI